MSNPAGRVFERGLVRDALSIGGTELRYKRGRNVRLVGPDDGARSLDVNLGLMTPGAAKGPLHRHRYAESAYYVVAGTAGFQLGADAGEMGEGCVIFVPAGTPHSISNVGSDELRIVSVYGPCGTDFEALE